MLKQDSTNVNTTSWKTRENKFKLQAAIQDSMYATKLYDAVCKGYTVQMPSLHSISVPHRIHFILMLILFGDYTVQLQCQTVTIFTAEPVIM